MAYIKRFEDIRAWQEARTLTRGVYRLARSGVFGNDYDFRSQIQRAAVSSMSNIAEGFDCDSNKEFARFLGIARRSVVEVQSLLHGGGDVGYINRQTFKEHYEQAETTKALIGGFLHSLRKRERNS